MPRILSVVALSLVTIASLSCTAKPTRGDIAGETTGECKLEWREPEAAGDVVAPFSLTSSEGIGLELLSLDARAVVDDPLAFTELTMVFRNPEARVIEGRFEITLPPGAAISRFAMKINNEWMEAEVVELQAARRAYEDALHRRQDPALLEKNAGNRFSARVFPIPANGVKEIIVSYSETLSSNSEPYRLHLRGLPKLKDLGVDVVVPRASGPEHLSLREKDFMPQKDLELATARRSAEVGLRYDRLAVARVAPDIKLPQESISGVTLLFDTSASRAVDFKGQVSRLGKIIEELRGATGNDFELRVLCFDQTVEPVFTGKASSFSADAQQAILKRNALGASDLAGALKYVADNPSKHERLLVVSDGIATAGDTDRDKLRAAASALGKAGVRRIDAVVDGGVQDEISLKQITGGTLERDGIVVNARLPAPLLASRLVRATRSDLAVRVPGATWVWPQTLDAVQPGDQVMIYADLPADAPMHVEFGAAGEGSRDVPLKTSERPLLERAWVKANIDRLSAALDGSAAGKAEMRKQILDLSVKYRVLSDYTALLVLETENDYVRFGIDRTALAEILTVGPSGITTIDRSRMPVKNNNNNMIAREEPTDDDRPLLEGLFGDADKEAKSDRAAPASANESAKRAERPSDGFDTKSLAPGSTAGPRGGEGRARDEGSMGGAPEQGAESDSVRPDPTTPTPQAAPMPNMRPPADPRPERITIDQEIEEEKAIEAPKRKRLSTADMRRPRPIEPSLPPPPPPPRPIEHPRKTDAYDGRYAIVMQQVDQNNQGGALREAWLWREQSPGDELALLALGEAAEASGDMQVAARAYGSLIDLFPGRADTGGLPGARPESLGPVGLTLAVDTFAQAALQRPDHPSSHRLYAFALLKAGRHAEAFAAALLGSQQAYPWGRFAGVDRILAEDLRLIAAAWLTERPMDEKTIRAELTRANVTPDNTPSLRFVLNWETDANDVDFHIYDGRGGHAYYSNRSLPSGGELYADVTTGYGPECFTVPMQASAFPYVLQGHYYSRGPMGYGMGKLEVIEHDGLGHLRFKEHPFVIMKDGAFVDLGTLDGPLAKAGPGARLEQATPGKPGPSGSTYTPPPPIQPGAAVPPTRF